LIRLLFQKIFNLSRFITTENIDGIIVYRIDGFFYFPPSKHTNHYGWLQAGNHLWKRYSSVVGSPDIIHAHNAVYAGLLAKDISTKTGIPYCITEHSSYIARDIESKFIKNKIKSAYHQANSLFVVSNFLGEKLDQFFKTNKKWKLVPNVLDSEIEEAPYQVDVMPTRPFIFINIASLIPLKRQQDLINAFHKKFSTDKDVRLVIGGEGELKHQLQEQIHRLQLSKQIQLTDRLTRQDVLKLIDSSHCLILCSQIETFGVVLIEALSRGKPIIATKCGGPESIVNEENGILCPANDTDALADAMKQMINKYIDYSNENIRKDAISRFGQKTIANTLIKEYEAIIS